MSRLIRCAAILALGLLFAPLWANSAFADRRVALIIGNSAYQHAPTLPNPAKDARAIAAMFQKAGFDVVNASYDLGNLDFKRAIRQFEDAAAGADIAVIYYAGHGIEIHGINYVVPIDAKLASDRDADDEAITLERLVESVDDVTKLRVIILDACRDNPFARTMKQQRTAALRGINPGLGAAEPTDTNTLIAYAAKAGSAAEDGEGDHSPFAAALLDNLFVPGLDVRLAFGRVRDEVRKKTGNRQEPFVYGSLGGDNIALVPAPSQQPSAAADLQGEKGDYNLVAQIGTKGAWQVFLNQHPTGFYADLARAQVEKLNSESTTIAASDGGAPRPTLVVMGSTNSPINAQENTSRPASPAPAPNIPQPAAAARETRKPSAPQIPNSSSSAAPAKSEPETTVVASLEAPKPPSPSGPSTEELRAWDKIKNSSNEADYLAFIKKYRTSPLAEVAQAHVDAIERAAQEKAQAEAAKRAEAERQAQAAIAKRQADEAARQKAEQEAALARAQQEAKAAAEAQKEAEREAELKREEEARQAALAEAAREKQQADAKAARQKAEQEAAAARAQQEAAAQAQQQAKQEAELKQEEEARQAAQAEAARAKQQAEAEAARKQAEQEAALAAAQQASQAAEQARLDAERTAQAKQQAACKDERDRLTSLEGQGSKAKDDLAQLQQSLTCEQLRPLVTAALDKANAKPDVNTPNQIRLAQRELIRLGCYSGAPDGSLTSPTTDAVRHYQSERGTTPTSSVEITDAFISDLKSQSSRVCPLACSSGKVADGERCIAAREPTSDQGNNSSGRHNKEQKSASRREQDQEKHVTHHAQEAHEAQHAARPQVIQQATSYSGGGHSAGTTIGVGF